MNEDYKERNANASVVSYLSNDVACVVASLHAWVLASVHSRTYVAFVRTNYLAIVPIGDFKFGGTGVSVFGLLKTAGHVKLRTAGRRTALRERDESCMTHITAPRICVDYAGEIAKRNASRAGSSSSSSTAAARRAKRREAEGGSGTLPSSANDSSSREAIASTRDSNEKDTKGPRLRYDDGEHVLDSSAEYNGAVPGAIHVPGRGNNAATSATTDESSSGVVVEAEVAPDRELLVEEAYEKGALDRERALQEAEVAVAVPDDDSAANGKKMRTVICLVGLVVVIAVGLLIGFLVQGKDGDGTSAVVPTSPPSPLSDLLPPLEESLQFPLSLCQGDCDSDVDCQDGLECFQRTRGMDVPGCSGGQQDLSGTDYCIMIEEEVEPVLEESTEFPLGICQGDCDSNADCKAGLICFQRNEGDEVPGCFGGADDVSRNDYCINQGQFMERFGERLVGSPDDNFGSSVALSSDGRTMAVGAVDLGSTGYVNIYESVEESSWDLVATIVGDNIGDQFGHSVELSSDGRTIAIGYVLDLGFPDGFSAYPIYSARVRVFGASLANKTIWNLIGEDISGEDYDLLEFDYSFSLSGNGTILALAEPDQISVYRYERSEWARIQSPGIDLRKDPTVSLSKSIDTVRIVTLNYSESVQVYHLTDDYSWQQIGEDIDNWGAVTLSGDGNVLAVAETDLEVPCYDDDPLCATSATYTVRIYEITSGGNWTELGDPIVLDAGTTDTIPAVSLSNDGQVIAVGETLYEDVGRVRLLQYYNVSEEWTIVDDSITGHSSKERFGADLSLAGSVNNITLAVGAPFLFSTSGAPGSVTSYRKRLGEEPSVVVSEPTAAPTSLPVTFDVTSTWTGHEWEFDEGIIGGSVSLSSNGQFLAYGAVNMDSVGAVAVYDLMNEATCISCGEINGDEVGGGFGHAVSLSGDGRTLAVGIPFSAKETIPNVGRVRVFVYDESTVSWSQIGSDIEPVEVPGDVDDDPSYPQPEFGHSVALSDDGTILAVGAISGYSSEGYDGNVDVFRFENGEWVQMGNPIFGGMVWSDGSVGWAVSLSSDGMRLAVAANTEEIRFDEAGAGRIYEFVDGTWQQLGQALIGEGRHDLSGTSISLSGDGNIVAIGSIGNSNDGGKGAGHVRIFEYDSNEATWRLLGKPIIGRSPGASCGSAVSLSFDGMAVAVGADSAGYVQVLEYDVENTYWHEISATIEGDSNGGRFGASIALSYDSGEMAIAVGAPLVTTRMDVEVKVVGKVYHFRGPNRE
eukprot:scaffold12403_cov148-Cylindrotheca_fusiformis.AAC.3